MNLEQLPLPRQVELVFREIREELSSLTAGIIFLQIRNNVIGKFGIKHFALESKDGFVQAEKGLSEIHFHAFRQMAVDSLRHKKNWTHGEILFEFAVKQNQLVASVAFESNYNMANLLVRK